MVSGMDGAKRSATKPRRIVTSRVFFASRSTYVRVPLFAPNGSATQTTFDGACQLGRDRGKRKRANDSKPVRVDEEELLPGGVGDDDRVTRDRHGRRAAAEGQLSDEPVVGRIDRGERVRRYRRQCRRRVMARRDDGDRRRDGDQRTACDEREPACTSPTIQRHDGPPSAERGVLRQDEPLKLLQLGTWLDGQFLDEQGARGAVDLERFGLATCAVEGKHQLPTRPLPQRLPVDQCAQHRERFFLASERDQPVRPIGLSRGSELVEPADLGLRERFEAKVGECVASPEGERGRQRPLCLSIAVAVEERPSLGREPPELDSVQLAGPEAKEIAAANGLDPVCTEGLAEPGHVHLDALRGVRRASRPPQLLDDPVYRERLVRVDGKQREKRSFSAGSDGHLAAVVHDCERPQQAHLHSPRR